MNVLLRRKYTPEQLQWLLENQAKEEYLQKKGKTNLRRTDIRKLKSVFEKKFDLVVASHWTFGQCIRDLRRRHKKIAVISGREARRTATEVSMLNMPKEQSFKLEAVEQRCWKVLELIENIKSLMKEV